MFTHCWIHEVEGNDWQRLSKSLLYQSLHPGSFFWGGRGAEGSVAVSGANERVVRIAGG